MNSLAAHGMYTREQLELRRTAVKRLERRDGGAGGRDRRARRRALIFIRWAEAHFPRRSAVALEGTIFLAFVAPVGWLLWRMQRRIRAARPVCPHCGVLLAELSERVAVATGRCDSWGGKSLHEVI